MRGACHCTPSILSQYAPHSCLPRRLDVRCGSESRGMRQNQLCQYYKRVNLHLGAKERERTPESKVDVETLQQVHFAHVTAIPFENLDLVYGPAQASTSGVATDLESVYQKLVVQRRGGYCFETNELFAHVLDTLGFQVHTVGGRVVLSHDKEKVPLCSTIASIQGAVRLGGIDHEVILVRLEDETWVCDVGFGGQTCREPVLLCDPPLSWPDTTGKGGLHRVRRGLLGMPAAAPSEQGFPHKQGWYMQKYSKRTREWADLYFFTEHEWRPLDFEIPNFWCSHRHPLFCKEVVVALQTGEGRKTLTGCRLRVYEAGTAREEEIRGDEEMADALASHFGLEC